MKLFILRNSRTSLRDERVRKVFMDLVELRQRIYMQEYPEALILDKYDLIADHLLLYSTMTGRPMAYVRSVTQESCDLVRQPLPIEQVANVTERHQRAYSKFRQMTGSAVNMSYLCLDKEFKHELEGIKIIDVMTWAALKVSGIEEERVGYCATPNMKFKLGSWLDQLGPRVAELPPFNHPVIPEPHDLVMIPSIKADYWVAHKNMYQWILDDADYMTGDMKEKRIVAA